MHALITGATGLLGRAVLAAFQADPTWTVRGSGFRRTGPGLDRVDLRDPAAVRAWVLDQRPEVLIHTAAERRPDACEVDPSGTEALNVAASRALAEACREVGAWMLCISTDYVFDGTRPPYRPEDTPNPINAYGRSKLAGERAVLEAHPGAAVLRLPILYGPAEDLAESAVTVLLENLRADPGRQHPMDAWAIRYPTFTPDVAAWIHILAAHCPAGIFHGSGLEAMTKADMARVLAELDGRDPACVRPEPGPGQGAPRPQDCHLDSARLESFGLLPRTPFREGVAVVLGH